MNLTHYYLEEMTEELRSELEDNFEFWTDENEGDEALVARTDDGDLAGFMQWVGQDIWYIQSDDDAPKGTGSTMIEWAKQNIDQYELHAILVKEEAIGFWEKMGFEDDGKHSWSCKSSDRNMVWYFD